MAPPGGRSGDAALHDLARTVTALLSADQPACPGCRNEVVVQIALGVIDRWRHAADAATVGVPARDTWDDSVAATVDIALTDMLVGSGNARAANMATTVTKRYRACVTELLERLTAPHEGFRSDP